MVESETLHECLKIPLRVKSPKCAQFSMWNVCLFGDLQELFFCITLSFNLRYVNLSLLLSLIIYIGYIFFNEANCYLLQNLSCNLTGSS